MSDVDAQDGKLFVHKNGENAALVIKYRPSVDYQYKDVLDTARVGC